MSAQIVLDRSRFKEARDLLGPIKFGSALGLFKAQLDDTFSLTEGAEPPSGGLQILAHKLASSAGFLGFEELSLTSRDVTASHADSRAVCDMHRAAQRALKALAEAAV